MEFDLQQAKLVLRKTPKILESLLTEINEKWIFENEGEQTWNPFDILGHLIEGEKNDWMVRSKIILSDGPKEFTPFDRFSQNENSKGKSLQTLLREFKTLRTENLNELEGLEIEANLSREGIHPEFGPVTLKQLLATWVVHDLNHLHQMSRVMSKRYIDEVGPWKQYLGVLN